MNTNILVYGISNQKGGISEFMMTLNKSLIKKNLTFDYIIKGSNSLYEPQIQKMGGKVFYYNYKNSTERILNLYKILKKERAVADIFYYNTSGTYFIFPIILAKLMKYKIISHAHNSKDIGLGKTYTVLNMLNRQLLNITSSIKFTCSSMAKKWVYGNSKNVIQINNAIDSNKFYYDNAIRKKTRTNLKISNNEILITNIGRFGYQKNQIFLLNIMNEINKKNTKIKLLLVGSGNDYKKLLTYVKTHNIKNVYMPGQKNNINEILNASDLFLLPSYFEGFPIVSVEAQATGLPCILSDRITKDSNITGLVKFLSLSEPKKWIDYIIYFKPRERRDMNIILKEHRFDVNSISNEVYDNILKIKKRINDD